VLIVVLLSVHDAVCIARTCRLQHSAAWRGYWTIVSTNTLVSGGRKSANRH